ncbi:hypothetical protein J4E93_001059 [Alternaria ventricosa]|uniref:uncharacterized protein n=1 Tax=Alternaria ventricosa TaxID=1187951 RepID=UPI0020C3FB9A|nr:uncharacterized protein J4E93_001059 [Alternaria ventricosa]KAI4653297.1 hypothetical protein J4E93_001059 [Alternaria ventricosa]
MAPPKSGVAAQQSAGHRANDPGARNLTLDFKGLQITAPVSLLDLPPVILCGIIQATDYQTALRLCQTHRHFCGLVEVGFSHGPKLQDKIAFVVQRAYAKCTPYTLNPYTPGKGYLGCRLCYQVYPVEPNDPNFDDQSLGVCRDCDLQCGVPTMGDADDDLLRGTPYHLHSNRLVRFCLVCGHLVYQDPRPHRPTLYCPCIKDVSVGEHLAAVNAYPGCSVHLLPYLPTYMRLFDEQNPPSWPGFETTDQPPPFQAEEVGELADDIVAAEAFSAKMIGIEVGKLNRQAQEKKREEEEKKRVLAADEMKACLEKIRRRQVELKEAKAKARIERGVMFTVGEALVLYKKGEGEGFPLDLQLRRSRMG